jgi:N-acetylglucosaminyl-diphospho-decaprenol L-rhamnosyltransferase
MRDVQVAVLIVTYKSALLAIESIRSLENERTDPQLQLRVIIVDNASGDFPLIAKAIEANNWSSWVTLIKAPRNGGFGYGNNLAMAQAFKDGPPTYIHLLNPDTQVRPGAIDSLVQFLEARPEVGIAGGSFENQNGEDNSVAFRFPTLLSEVDSGIEFGLVTEALRRWVVAQPMGSAAQPVDWVSGASMMIRPAVISAIGGFDENYFLYFEETDFCFRANRAGFSTWYVPKSRVMHIIGQSTNIADATNGPRRMPAYWFESRRRYFAVTHGITHAITIDFIAVLARLLGHAKRIILGRRRTAIPYYIRDLFRYSVVWRRNRPIPPAKCSILRC